VSEVRVTSGTSGYEQSIVAGAHTLVSDEPRPAGGDAGMDPYELLLGALGACTAMTIQMYARRKSWSLGRVRVDLSYERVHSKDCEDCEDTSGRVHRIERVIELEGALSDEQRDRLLEIADLCPVHRTLTEPKEMVTRLT
jgi:putative redox protein